MMTNVKKSKFSLKMAGGVKMVKIQFGGKNK